MSIFNRFLLPAVAIVPLILTGPVSAQEGVAKPAKSAQDCADELLRNKEAIEAGGETPQEFFHRCWWDSVPGKPTPIKTPRATWDPGRSHPSRNTLAKPPIEAKRQGDSKKPIEAKRPIEAQKAHAKLGEQGIAEGKRPGATKQASDVKPAVSPKLPAANRPTERGTGAEPKKPVEATTAAKPAKREAAGSKAIVPAPASEPKRKETAATKAPVQASRAQAPKATSVITAPNAAPASVKPAAAGEVVVQSRPKRTHTRAAAARTRRLPHEITRPVEAREVPPAWRLSRHMAARPAFPHPVGYAHRFRPSWMPPREAFARRAWAAQGPVLCVYAAPDARGRSACVPVQ